jgi:hypothetical protein
MTYWIDKFMMYAANDSMLNDSEFQRLLSDRTISYKLRSTIDYIEVDLNLEFLKESEEKAQAASSDKKDSNPAPVEKEDPIPEDDYFIHGVSAFIQQKKSPVYKGIKAPVVKKLVPQRSVIFNILDTDMDGKLAIKEFFELIK